jgi:hypothetical protein
MIAYYIFLEFRPVPQLMKFAAIKETQDPCVSRVFYLELL